MESPIFMVPGEQIKAFKWYPKQSISNDYGKVLSGDSVKKGTIFGSISQAKQREKHEWNQNGHPISHTIVVHDFCEALPEDILVDQQDREFIIQGVDDPAGMGFFFIIYCLFKKGNQVVEVE